MKKPIQNDSLPDLDAESIILDACPVTSKEAERAKLVTTPTVKGANTILEYSKKFGEVSLAGLINELANQVKAAKSGDMSRAESMLMVQAHTLDAIFNHLAQRAISASGIDTIDRCLRLAMKAQSQCRATIETLAVMKNPQQIAFVQQANIGQAVQVNNQTDPVIRHPEKKFKKVKNKVLERDYGERLDSRAASKASAID